MVKQTLHLSHKGAVFTFSHPQFILQFTPIFKLLSSCSTFNFAFTQSQCHSLAHSYTAAVNAK